MSISPFLPMAILTGALLITNPVLAVSVLIPAYVTSSK